MDLITSDRVDRSYQFIANIDDTRKDEVHVVIGLCDGVLNLLHDFSARSILSQSPQLLFLVVSSATSSDISTPTSAISTAVLRYHLDTVVLSFYIQR